MILLPVFDPTNPSSGQFNLNLTGGYGKAVFYNESDSNLKLIFSNGFTEYLPAWVAIEICFLDIPLTNPIVNYSTVSSLGAAGSPISQVAIVTYEASERVGGTFPAPLVRQVSANLTSSQATSVANDANPSNTVFIEATQSGNTVGSNIIMQNTGDSEWRQWVSNTITSLLKIITGATPEIRIGKGVSLNFVDNGGIDAKCMYINGSDNLVLQPPGPDHTLVLNNGAGNTVLFMSGSLQLAPNIPIAAFDGAFNYGQLLGLDGSNNTMLQAHTTGNKVTIVDKNQNILLEISGRNTTLQGGDSSSVLGNIFGVDVSGNTFLQSHPTNNQTVLYDKNGVTLAIFDSNLCLNVTGNIQTVTGDTSGTMTVQEIFSGGSKWVMVKQNNYRQNGAAQQLILKNTFTGPFGILNLGCGGMQILNGASVQSGNYLNSMVATGSAFSAETAAGQCTIGWNNTAIDRVQSQGGYASPHTGIFILVGF